MPTARVVILAIPSMFRGNPYDQERLTAVLLRRGASEEQNRQLETSTDEGLEEGFSPELRSNH